MPYNAGDAYLRIIPVFRGIAEKINAEAKKWSATSGRVFSQGFNRIVAKETANAGLGPSDAQSAKAGSSSGGAFARAFRTRIDAALKALPDVDVDANTSPAERKIAEIRARLAALRNAELDVDIDTGEAMAELAAIRADLTLLAERSPSVRVDVDAARALTELAAIQGAVAALDAEDISINPDTGGVDRYSSKIGALTGAFAALLAISGPVAGALSAVAVAGASALGAIAGGGIVGALGLSNVSNTVDLLKQREKALTDATAAGTKAMSDQAGAADRLKDAQTALANAKARAADQEINSAQRVTDAERNLAKAREDAAEAQARALRNVQDAEENLARAAQQSLDAQAALNDARAKAAEDLKDYANQAIDADLAVRAAQLQLQEAQKRQAELGNPGENDSLTLAQAQLALQEAQMKLAVDQTTAGVSALQLEKDRLSVQAAQLRIAGLQQRANVDPADAAAAALAVDQAQQRLSEAQLKAQRATDANNKAQQDGIEGAPGVVSAKQRIIDATERQADAAQALADAQTAQAKTATDSAERIADAQRGIADALRAQAASQRTSAQSIQSAQSSLAAAMRATDKAAVGVGTSGVSSLASIDAQLAQVNPATLTLAKLIQDKVKPAFQELKDTASGSLAPGLIGGLLALGTLMPQAKEFVSTVGSTLGGLFQQAATSLAGPFWGEFFGYVQDNVGPMLTVLASIGGNLIQGLAGMMMAFQPITDVIFATLDQWSEAFANWANGEGVQKFVQYITETGPAVASAVGSAIGMIIHLADAFTPLGLALLNLLDYIGQIVQSLSPDGLSLAFAGIGALMAALGGPIAVMAGVAIAAAGVGNLIASHWSKIQPVVQPVFDLFSSIWSFITDKLAPAIMGVLSDAWDGLKSAVGTVTDAIERNHGWIDKLMLVLKGAADFIATKLVPTIGPLLKGAFELAGGAISTAIDLIGNLIDIGKAVYKFFKDIFTGNWSAVWGDLKDIVSGVVTAISEFFGDIGQTILDALGTAKDKILSGGKKIIGWIKDGVTTAWSTIKSWFGDIGNHIWDAIKDAASTVTGFGGRIIGWIRDGISSGWPLAVSWLAGIPGRIWGVIKDMGSDIKGYGGSIIGWVKDGISNGWSTVSSWLAGIPGRIWNAIKGAKDRIVGFGKDILGWIGDGISAAASTIKDAMRGALNFVIDIVNKLIRGFNAATGGLSKVWTWAGIPAIPAIPEIPRLAKGAMTTGPMLALIGDNPSGREVALPLGSSETTNALARALSQAQLHVDGGLGGRGTQVNQYINNPAPLSPAQLARETSRYLAFAGGM